MNHKMLSQWNVICCHGAHFQTLLMPYIMFQIEQKFCSLIVFSVHLLMCSLVICYVLSRCWKSIKFTIPESTRMENVNSSEVDTVSMKFWKVCSSYGLLSTEFLRFIRMLKVPYFNSSIWSYEKHHNLLWICSVNAKIWNFIHFKKKLSLYQITGYEIDICFISFSFVQYIRIRR